MGVDVQLDEEQSVHDVAALLKEFLRDMPDPLLPRELYPAFLHANRKATHSGWKTSIPKTFAKKLLCASCSSEGSGPASVPAAPPLPAPSL